ncbi:hypothetical protein PIIN_08172 [Serendipita indica DSM 11827]|uniref:Uncharacterized protein n=1 Tax=Serendipita indica (strain DSM 11827) TaxID=1109443 RepID=G4TSC6_SERID|nr:hypothetical protein PIIN_08172 [Serendipita indica DSM 11827]
MEARELAVQRFITSVAPQLKRLRYLGDLRFDVDTVYFTLESVKWLRPLHRTLAALRLHLCRWIHPSSVQYMLALIGDTLPYLKAVLLGGYEVGVRFRKDNWVQVSENTQRYNLRGWDTLNGDLERLTLSRA